VEERLSALARLERKHGGTIAAVLAHAEACRARRAEMAGAEVALEEATAALADARADLERRAGGLRDARLAAAPTLAAAVRERLAALAMEAASFEIAVEPRPEAGPTGADAVEFRIAANPGGPGGAAARGRVGRRALAVMLALLGVANDDSDSVLVFDEIDAGIGGVTPRAGRAQLRDLAAGRQVLCITHLPQIASLGARHFSIAKDVGTEPARTLRPRARAGRGGRRARADARRGGGRRGRPPARQGAAQGGRVRERGRAAGTPATMAVPARAPRPARPPPAPPDPLSPRRRRLRRAGGRAGRPRVRRPAFRAGPGPPGGPLHEPGAPHLALDEEQEGAAGDPGERRGAARAAGGLRGSGSRSSAAELMQ
jgi:hypothetical protein